MNFLSNKSTSCKRCALAREEIIASQAKRARRGQERCAIDHFERERVGKHTFLWRGKYVHWIDAFCRPLIRVRFVRFFRRPDRKLSVGGSTARVWYWISKTAAELYPGECYKSVRSWENRIGGAYGNRYFILHHGLQWKLL